MSIIDRLMDSLITQEDRDAAAAGFTATSIPEVYMCPLCFCLTADWHKHKTICKPL